MNFRSTKWTVILLILLIIFSVGVFLKFSLSPDSTQGFEAKFLGLFSKNLFLKQSHLMVTLSGAKLNLKFDIADQDKQNFSAFLKNLGSDNEEVQTLNIGLDKNTAEVINPVLPAELDLEINDKSLIFKNKTFGGLQNALVKSDIDFATSGGSLKVRYTDNSKYQMQIEKPEALVNYATGSGILTLSSKIEGLFKTLPKVATIELNASGKSISGKVVLK